MSEVDFTIEAQAEGGYWSILKASYSKDRFGTEVPLDVHLHTEKLDYSRILKFNFKFPKWMDYRQLTAIGLIKIAHKLLSSWLRQSCSHDEVRLGLITDSVRGYFKNLWTHIIRNKDRFATFTDDFKSPIDKHKSQFKIFDLEFSILLLATLRLSLQRQKSHLISSSLIEKELILKEKVEYWREAYARRGLTEPGDAKEIACMEVLAESDYAWTQHHSQAKVYEMVESDLDSILKNTSFDKGGDYFKAEVVKRVEMLKEQAAARNESPRQLLIELFNHSQMATGFVASKWTSNTQTGVERAMAYFAELVRGLLDSSSNLIVDLVAIANSIAEGQKNSLDILSKLLDDSVDFCIQKDGYLHDLGEITVQLKRRPEALKVLNVQILNRFFVKGQLKTFKSLVRHADWLDLNEPQKIEYVKDLLEGVLMESELELATHRDLLVEASENNYPVHYYYIQNAVVQKYKNYSDKSQLIEYVAMVQNERYGKGKEFSDEYTKLLFDIVFENGTSFTYADLRNLLSNFEHVWKRFLSLVMKGCDSKALILENLLSYSKSPNDHLKNYPYFSHGLSLLASMDKPQTDWQDASTFLLAFLDILSKLHVPQKLLRELQLDYHSRKVAFSCAERAKNFINIVAQFTAPSKEAMNDHQETVKDLVQKCLLSFEEYQKRAKMYQEKVRLPCYDCLSVVVNTQRFNKIVDALGNDKSVTTDFSVLVRDFEAELDVDSKDIDIFLESHDDNVLVSKLCLCLTKRIEAGKPENLKEYLANLAGSAIDGLVSELEQQLNVSYILSMDVPKLDLSYGDAARLFKTSVSLFEELVVKMAFEPSANLNMIASNLLKLGSFSMKNALNSSYKYFKNPRTLESLAFLRKDRYQQLECLKNMAWLTNSTLIQSLISFIETYKRAAIKGKEAAVKDMEASVVDKEPNLQDKKPENILDLLSILLKNKEEKLLLADYDKELTAIILPVLVEHDKAKEYLKEISEDTYGLLEQVKTLSEDQINEMTLGQAELKQYSLKQEDVLILKGIRSAIENSKTWEEVIRNLHQQCSKEAEGCFKNLELIKNPESVSKFLKDYMSNLLTSEERKRSNILRILEGAIFCYYRDHDADCYSLYVFIKSEEPERQFDMKDPLEMNLQKDWRVMLEESKTKQANVVTQEEFISMKAITDFMLKYDAGQAKLRKFNGTARSAISILEMINQLEKDCHVTNLQTAIQAIYKELEIQLKLNLIDNRFNSISFEINLKEETSSPELEGLNEIIKFLVSRCKEAKEKVFSSMVHQYYPWSCFQPFQLKLLDTYLQKASKKGEKIELTDIADKTRLLIDYVDAPFSLDSSAANLNMVKPNIGITYSLLDTFSKIFEVDHDSKPKAPSNLQRTGKARFRRIQFDQSNRMKTLIEVFSKDHNRQQNRISESAFTHHHEQKQRKTRALFCSSFTKWSEIEIFLAKVGPRPRRA
jgi:hypothetical protein